jgi:hypothetical protein
MFMNKKVSNLIDSTHELLQSYRALIARQSTFLSSNRDVARRKFFNLLEALDSAMSDEVHAGTQPIHGTKPFHLILNDLKQVLETPDQLILSRLNEIHSFLLAQNILSSLGAIESYCIFLNSIPVAPEQQLETVLLQEEVLMRRLTSLS